ncbi:reticulocyte binding protein 2b (RBP2b) [Plasmodium ovale curtisi]|uniref:Reticulocyte binding protein 2b (RBP2b) n=1 Tax=Plasmodium ovale curtisi TaxID=864141 RepID=A0A1A8X530_PLAOA|nr:reticulocyte binding protein 2b (RBP2b) [Plasmodium ovale curtisi]
MGKKILLAIFYQFLFLYFVSSKDGNRSKSKKLRKELKLIPINSNLVKNSTLENNNGEKKHITTSNGNINNKEVRESHVHNGSSFVTLKDHVSTRKSSYYPFIKRDNFHKFDIDNNKSKNINNEFNTAINSFIQKNTKSPPRKPAPRRRPTNYPKPVVAENLEYIDAMDTHNNVISQLKPHHLYIYYFSEMTHFTTYYNEIKETYKKNYEQRIKNLSNEIAKGINVCAAQKNDLKNSMISLEDPEKHKILPTIYKTKTSEYKTKKEKYISCLLESYNKNFSEISKIKLDTLDILAKIECRNICSTQKYIDKIGAYLLKVKEFNYEKYNNYRTKVMETYNNGVDVLHTIETEIGSKFSKDVTKFIQDELKYIIERLDYHLNRVKYGFDEIEKLSKTNILSQVTGPTLRTYYDKLAYFYALFKLSSESIGYAEYGIKKKEEVLYKSFENFEKDIQNKIIYYTESEFFIKEVNYDIAYCKRELSYAEDVYKRKYKIISEHVNYSNDKIRETKVIFDRDKKKLDEVLDKLRILIHDMSNKLKWNTLKRDDINRRRKIKYRTNGKERAIYLLNLIKDIRNYKPELTKNFNEIKEIYKGVDPIKIKMEVFKKTVENSAIQLEGLIIDEKANRPVKEDIKRKMEHISKNIDNIKKIITTDEEINKNILEIDELIKGSSSNMSHYTNKKTEFYEKLKSIINKHFGDKLQEFLSKAKQFLNENKSFFDRAYTINNMQKLLEETNEIYDRMKNMEFDNVSKVLVDINKESKNLLDLKDDIYKENLKNLKGEMLNNNDQLKNKYKDLTNMIDEYKKEKTKFVEYRDKINKRENNFLSTLLEIDSDTSEEQNDYTNFLTHKVTIADKETKISNEIYKIKEYITGVQNKIPSYIETLKKLDAHKENTYSEFTQLLHDFDKEKIDLELSKYENEFKDEKEIIHNIIKETENSNSNIDTIKILNTTINRSNDNNTSIEGLIKNKKHLKEKIEEYIEEVNKDELIKENEKTKLLNEVNGKNNQVDKELADAVIHDLKKKIENSLRYCESAKKEIQNNKGKRFEITEKDKIDWNSIQIEIEKLNKSHQLLSEEVEKIIVEQYKERITLIYKHITEEGNRINEKAQENINTLEQMKNRLNTLAFNTNNEKTMDSTIQAKLSTLKENVTILLTEIEKKNNKLINVKERSNGYMQQSNEIKDEGIEFTKKRSNMKNIYEELKKLFEELSDIEKEQITFNKISDTELEYEKILIDRVMKQINDENEITKHVMAEIESAVKKIEEIKLQIDNPLQKDISNFQYSVFNEQSKINKSNVEQNVSSAMEKREKANKSGDINEVKELKEKINENMKEVTKEKNAMQEALKQIKNITHLLISNNAESVILEILKSTKNAEDFSIQSINKFNKTDDVLNDVQMKVRKANEHKEKIMENLDNDQIDEKVNAIKKIEQEIIQKKEEMNKYIRKAEEHKKQYSSEILNANRGKTKIEILKTHNVNKGTNFKEIDTKEAYGNISKSEDLLKEIESKEKVAKQNLESLLEQEKRIKNILSESSILAFRTKSNKSRNKAEEIMGEIKTEYTTIQEKLQNFQEKLNHLSEESTIKDASNDFDNEMSMNANVTIEHNLGSVKQSLLDIGNIKKEVDQILDTAKETLNLIKQNSENGGNNPLENAEKKEANYIKYLDKMEKEKQHIKEKRTKLSEIDSDIQSIEKKLKENKKNYEIGLLKKVHETAKNRKSFMDSAEEKMVKTMREFTSLFNRFDLKDYKFEENLDNNKKKINQYKNEFDTSYKIIEDHVQKVSSNSTDYTEANRLRIEAVKEEGKLRNKEEETKKYLKDVEKMESLRLIYHIKEHLGEIMKKSEKKYSEVNENYNDIKGFIHYIENSDDENSSLEKLRQATDKNEGIQNKTHHEYINEAKNMLEHIVNAADFIGIKVKTGLKLTEISTQADLKETSELIFESKPEIKIETESMSKNRIELDVYNNIQVAYKHALDILTNSKKIDNKQEECDKLIQGGNDICLKIKLINDLKSKVNSTKKKENFISSKIDDTLQKLNDLNKIKCNYNNDNNILEKLKSEKLKEIIRLFNESKSNSQCESKLNEIKEKFDNNKQTLNELEQEVLTYKANETFNENIEKENISVDEMSKKLDDIENYIKNVNYSLDALLEKGKECEISTYKSIKDDLKTKLDEESKIINMIQENAHIYSEHVNNNYKAITNVIGSLNEHFGEKQVNTYTLTNYEKANKSYTELFTAVNESRGIINSMKQEFIEINEQTEISTLEKSTTNLENLYGVLKDKKDQIKDVYKKINLVKLEDINTSSEKYNDMAKIFNEVLHIQKGKIIRNNDNIKRVIAIITNQKNELVNVDSTFSLESIKKFYEIYDIVMTNISELNKFEENNNSEHIKVKTYQENASLLTKEWGNLQQDIDKYEKNEKIKNENEYIIKDVTGYITSINEIIKNSSEEFNKLLESLKENEQLSSKNYTKEFISDITRTIEDIKENFTRTLPEREKLFEIQNNYNEIKGIFDESQINFNLEEFIGKMSKLIRDEREKMGTLDDEIKIKKAIANIKKYNEETRSELSKIDSMLERIKKRKNDMDHLFSYFSKNNINLYNTAKRYVDASYEIVKEVDSRISRIKELLTNFETVLKELEEERTKLLSKNIVEPTTDDKNNLLNVPQEQAKSDIQNAEHEQSENKNHSHAKEATGHVHFAAGIILVLSILSGFAIFAFKDKNEDDNDLNVYDEEFEGSDNLNVNDKEELIEVCFNGTDDV